MGHVVSWGTLWPPWWSPGCFRSSITDCSEMGQSCCAGRSLKIQLKDCVRSRKHTKGNDHDWFLTTHPEVENGVYFAEIRPTGKKIAFPSLSMCQNGSESVRKASSCSEVKWWIDGLLCAGREGRSRSRHGQVSACLEALRRSLTLKESCQMRTAG